MISVRAQAAKTVFRTVKQRAPLKAVEGELNQRDRALLQELVLGTLRWHIKLCAILGDIADNPKALRGTLQETLIAIGLYQLFHTGVPAYAIVNETVDAAKELGLGRFAGLINAVLRRASESDFNSDDHVKKEHESFSYPKWLTARIKKDYPRKYRDILMAGNAKPSMWLRIDATRVSIGDYCAMLEKKGMVPDEIICKTGIRLHDTCPPSDLPGFETGLCYIQDASAMLASVYMAPQKGERILDACAAPGGKTIHMLELTEGKADITALDVKPQRLERLKENLKRRGLEITVKEGSASEPESWWDGKPFDRILLDAPCSGTGVIGRHPDIRFVRTEKEIDELAGQQEKMLEALWTLLKPGGILMYTTCSILRQENDIQINDFLYRHRGEATLEELPESQHLPQDGHRDGFFYAKILKQPSRR
ncbi:MAG: 16S rRNA (cytosine(967)-C(5))-methyltransferase RsmB [Succinivibrionaceae bacterium]|nr:16S rRNA (cytosine(967)-C(5))-methyltransferase RsmB [Succinivibrionaceae bacterium]